MAVLKNPLCRKDALKLVSSITEEMIFTSIKKEHGCCFYRGQDQLLGFSYINVWCTNERG